MVEAPDRALLCSVSFLQLRKVNILVKIQTDNSDDACLCIIGSGPQDFNILPSIVLQEVFCKRCNVVD